MEQNLGEIVDRYERQPPPSRLPVADQLGRKTKLLGKIARTGRGPRGRVRAKCC